MIEEVITNTIFQTVREKIVAEGYLPNINDFDIMNADPVIVKQQVDLYKASLKEIADGPKKWAIELFNYTSNEAKGEKKTPRIVIDVHQFLPGKLGNDTSIRYEMTVLEDNSVVYLRKRDAPQLSDLTYCVYAVASNAAQMRMMNHIIMNSLPYKGYMKPEGEPELLQFGNFFNVLRDKGHTPELAEGLMERYYIYDIPDIQEVETITLSGDPIALMNEITLLSVLQDEA